MGESDLPVTGLRWVSWRAHRCYGWPLRLKQRVDEPAARHAADLLTRAMELCGGGDPPEPGVGPIKPPADELRDAMKYLEDQIGNYGPVNFLVHEQHSQQVHAVNYATRITNFHADPQTCRISFHEHVSISGQQPLDVERGILLREVKQVSVKDQTHRLKETTWATQHVHADFLVEPETYVIDIYTKNDFVPVSTYDKDLALRLGRVIGRAAELCGGGPRTVY